MSEYSVAEQILLFLEKESHQTAKHVSGIQILDNITISLPDLRRELQRLADDKFIHVIKPTDAPPMAKITSNGRKHLNGSMQKKESTIVNNYGTINQNDSHDTISNNSSFVGGNMTSSQMGIQNSDASIEISMEEKQRLESILEQIKAILKSSKIPPEKETEIEKEIKLIEIEKESASPKRSRIKESLKAVLDNAGGVESLMSVAGTLAKFLTVL